MLLFQKALAACGTEPEDLAKAILLQKAWLCGYGNTPENIAKVLEDIMAKESGKEEMQSNLLEIILKKLSSEDMSCDDVLKAIMFNNALDTNGASVNIIKDLVNKSHKKPIFDGQDLSSAMQVSPTSDCQLVADLPDPGPPLWQRGHGGGHPEDSHAAETLHSPGSQVSQLATTGHRQSPPHSVTTWILANIFAAT